MAHQWRLGGNCRVYQYRNALHQSRRKTWAARIPGTNTGLTLDEARSEAKKLAGDVERGKDPVEDERLERRKAEQDRQKAEAAASTTLIAVAEDYLAKQCGLVLDEHGKVIRDEKGRAKFDAGQSKIRSGGERIKFFDGHVRKSKLADRQIDEIERSEIKSLLDGIEKDRGPQAAHKALAFLSTLFNWHASGTNGFQTPIVRGMGRVKPSERERHRILTDDELRAVWNVKCSESLAVFSRFVKFLVFTAVRRTEASKSHRKEITDSLWTVPAERMKGKRDFVVPLSASAVGLIEDHRGFLFSTDGGATPISGFSKLKRDLDKLVLAELRKVGEARDNSDLIAYVAKVEDLIRRIEGAKDEDERKRLSKELNAIWWTLHDVRRTARSLMSKAGVDADHAERCLAHKIGGVRGTYDRYAYLDKKRDALKKLAAQVDNILNDRGEQQGPPPADNVIPLKDRRVSQVPG